MNVDEFSGFRDVPCDKCGEKTTVFINGWSAEIREEVLMKFVFSPTVFICPACGVANTVCMDIKPSIVAKAEERHEPEGNKQLSPVAVPRRSGSGA